MKQKVFLALAITATTSMLAIPKFVQAQTNNNQLQITRIADLQRPRGIGISGRVQSVVGNKFTLNDGTGQIIVDAGPPHWRQINLNQGEQITVTGELSKSGREFNAFNIRRSNGSVIEIRSPEGPPPWAGSQGKPKPKPKP